MECQVEGCHNKASISFTFGEIRKGVYVDGEINVCPIHRRQEIKATKRRAAEEKASQCAIVNPFEGAIHNKAV